MTGQAVPVVIWVVVASLLVLVIVLGAVSLYLWKRKERDMAKAKKRLADVVVTTTRSLAEERIRRAARAAVLEQDAKQKAKLATLEVVDHEDILEYFRKHLRPESDSEPEPRK